MASPSEEQEPRRRGLPSIQQAREARGAGKFRWPPVKFWAYTAVILAITAIFHWRSTQSAVESSRQALLAKQRAAAAGFGPRWFPLRDQIERWTTELAAAPGAETIDHDALKDWDFRDKAGIYLRLRAEDARTPEAIRANATNSLRDAFTGCLMRVANPSTIEGKECKLNRDCPAGEFCNEVDHCSRPAQPFNLRVAYRTMGILSDAWVREVQDETNDLRVQALVGSYENIERDDLPLAADLLQRAKYFLLVLDEDVPGMKAPAADAGVSLTEAVQGAPHSARVGVWRLSDGKLLLRVRRGAGGKLLGATPAVDAEVLEARQRQANSCALALEVRTAMGDTGAAAVPPQ